MKAFLHRAAVVIGLVLALGLIAAPRASGDAGMSVGHSYPAFASSPSFRTLMYGVGGRWIRTSVTYDAVWTWNGSSCVATGNPAQAELFDSVWTAEREGSRVMLVVGGAPNPSDPQLRCGIAGIEYAISTWQLGQWQMPIEAWNEPDYNGGTAVGVYQAVNYFADAVQAGWGNSWFRPVAGVFSTGYGADSPGSYAWEYIAALTSSPYNRWASSWSWHDYGDVVHSPNCGIWALGDCGRYEAGQMLALLRGWREPTSDTWISESGDPVLFEPGQTRTDEAREAYAWERLKGAGEDHLLWYEFQATQDDTWDSALLDPDPRNQFARTGYGPRDPSYCVLAYNELPTQALGRCRG